MRFVHCHILISPIFLPNQVQTVEHKAFIVLERDTQIGSDERRKLSGEHDIRRFTERFRKAFNLSLIHI